MVTLLFFGVVVTSWLSEQPTWLRVLLLGSAVVTSLGFWWLFRMPTTCRIANRSNPRGCSNNVRGAFSACRLVDHKVRKRRLLWARLFGRTRVDPVAPDPSWAAMRAEPPAGLPAKAGPREGGDWLPGAGYHITMLVSTVLGGLGGMAGVVVMVKELGG